MASQSNSNYAYTMLSLASSLNMEYVNYLSDTIGAGSIDNRATYPLIQDNRVGRLLQSIGYRYVQIGSKYTGTNSSQIADEILSFWAGNEQDQFNSLLFATTVAHPLLKDFSPFADDYEANRSAILFPFDEIPRLGNRSQPVFVFAHIVSPHPPYVFGADGEYVSEPEGGPSLEETQIKYLNQLIFINGKVKELIDIILEQSRVQPIIILQSDHGWAWSIGWQQAPNTPLDETFDKHEIFGVLNAYYLPDNGTQLLYESISLVNTFRVVFKTYFGADLELLNDVSYFSDYYQSPYVFTDVTDMLDP